MRNFTDKELDEVEVINDKIGEVTLELVDLEHLSMKQLEQVCADSFGGRLNGKTKAELRNNIFLKSISIFED